MGSKIYVIPNGAYIIPSPHDGFLILYCLQNHPKPFAVFRSCTVALFSVIIGFVQQTSPVSPAFQVTYIVITCLA